jgi:SARP family transcriptional regulator, regulator of embCAB operon
LVGQARIQVCGPLAVELDGRRVDARLPGRQGRLLLVYLVVRRLRPVRREELIEALWPEEPPAAAEVALRALLSKCRRALSEDVLQGRGELRLVLPSDAHVDLEAARDGVHRAESALVAEDWARAWGACLVALFTARRGFLPGEDAEWICEVRREVEALYLRALECYAQAALGVGGTELAGAERAGRELVALAPFREAGYRCLMTALVRGGNVAEALLVYERLRALLRDELGVSPSPEMASLHAELLRGR